MDIDKNLIRHWGTLVESVETKDQKSFVDEDTYHRKYSDYKRTSDPSYNDVLSIRKSLNLDDSKFILTNRAYNKLSDEQK